MHHKSTCFCCLPASLGASVLLVSRHLWVPPYAFCGFAFLSRLLWDIFCIVSVPSSLVPPLLCAFVLYCPCFSGTKFCSIRVPGSLGPTTPCVLLVFCPGFYWIASVLLGSLILWFPPPLLCVLCVFVPYRLLWDSLCGS